MTDSHNTVPCKDCENRFVDEYGSCHSRCDRYKEWSRRTQAERKEIRRKRDLENLLNAKSPRVRRRRK